MKYFNWQISENPKSAIVVCSIKDPLTGLKNVYTIGSLEHLFYLREDKYTANEKSYIGTLLMHSIKIKSLKEFKKLAEETILSLQKIRYLEEHF